MAAVIELLQAIPYDQILIQTVNGIVTGMILALVASGQLDHGGHGSHSEIELLQAIPYDQILIQTVNGIVTGMILALVASGLTLIFGIMDVVNFAHGELFMLAAST